MYLTNRNRRAIHIYMYNVTSVKKVYYDRPGTISSLLLLLLLLLMLLMFFGVWHSV